jgi:hypothetical protein
MSFGHQAHSILAKFDDLEENEKVFEAKIKTLQPHF